MRESSKACTVLSLANLSKLVNLLSSTLFFYSHHIVLLNLLPLSPLVALLSPLVQKLQTELSVIMFLFCETVSHLIHTSRCSSRHPSPTIFSIDQASSFHLTHISLSFTVILFTPIFMLFDL